MRGELSQFLNTIMYAYLLVVSRSFGKNVGLAPIMELLNTDEVPNVSPETSQHERGGEGVVCMRALRPIKAGEELLDFYAQKTSDVFQFFHQYGFSMSEDVFGWQVKEIEKVCDFGNITEFADVDPVAANFRAFWERHCWPALVPARGPEGTAALRGGPGEEQAGRAGVTTLSVQEQAGGGRAEASLSGGSGGEEEF